MELFDNDKLVQDPRSQEGMQLSNSLCKGNRSETNAQSASGQDATVASHLNNISHVAIVHLTHLLKECKKADNYCANIHTTP